MVPLTSIQRELEQPTGTERSDLAQLYIDEVGRMLDAFGETVQRVQKEEVLLFTIC